MHISFLVISKNFENWLLHTHKNHILALFQNNIGYFVKDDLVALFLVCVVLFSATGFFRHNPEVDVENFLKMRLKCGF